MSILCPFALSLSCHFSQKLQPCMFGAGTGRNRGPDTSCLGLFNASIRKRKLIHCWCSKRLLYWRSWEKRFFAIQGLGRASFRKRLIIRAHIWAILCSIWIDLNTIQAVQIVTFWMQAYHLPRLRHGMAKNTTRQAAIYIQHSAAIWKSDSTWLFIHILTSLPLF